MKLQSFTSGNGSGGGNLDTAFQEVSQQVLSRVSPELRRYPSAAPSPILQCLLRLQCDHKITGVVKTEAHASTPRKMTPSTSVAQEMNQQRGGNPPGSVSSLLEQQLSKRGVAPKDPLLKRIAAYKSKISANSNSNDNNSRVLSDTGAVSHSFSSATPPGSKTTKHLQGHESALYSCTTVDGVVLPGVPEHWTQRRLSEMTPASWAIFREQLGIEVTPVSVRHPLQRGGDSLQGLSAAATRAAYMVDTVNPIRCWQEAQLPLALESCVSAFYALPTAIQAQCVPLAMAELSSSVSSVQQVNHHAPQDPEVLNKIDIIGVAETGSGKTLSYLIPALVDICVRRPKLLGNHELITLGPMALIMVPTRELAEQVTREALALLSPDATKMCFAMEGANLGKSSNLYTGRKLIEEWEERELSNLPNDASRAAYRKEHNMFSEIRVIKVVGGEKAEEQFEKLSRGAHVVVGTIGQLAAMLQDRFLSLGNAQFVVVDEADRMIDERQQDTLVAVLERCPRPRQTLLFTATMSRACEEIARKYLSPKGFFVVRTLHRCASIRQNFELIPLIDNSKREANTGKKASLRSSSTKLLKELPSEAAQRRLDPLIYPLKFNRLVTWLLYATGPIIIFAGEKRVCDALQDELRREATHLAPLLDEHPLPFIVSNYHCNNRIDNNKNKKNQKDSNLSNGGVSGLAGLGLLDSPSVDAPPQGLVFQEDTGLTGYAAQQRREAAERTLTAAVASAATSRELWHLENLTSTAVVHSELSQTERRRLTELFHRQERKVLITTDLLSRGLDVPGVGLVINYDLPWPFEKALPSYKGGPSKGGQETPEEAFVRYIHRIGRTGRAGATGIALSFVSLPLIRIQKAFSAIGVAANANPSGLHTQGQLEGSRGDELSRRIYPPGTTDVVKQRDRERYELTHLHDSYADTAFDSSELGVARDNADNDDDSDKESSGASDDAGRPRKHLRREEGTPAVMGGAENKEYPTLYSDESLLKPLWEFLVHCIEGNGYSKSEAVRALRQQTYSKIDLPPALAFIMHELATQKGKYGAITQ